MTRTVYRALEIAAKVTDRLISPAKYQDDVAFGPEIVSQPAGGSERAGRRWFSQHLQSFQNKSQRRNRFVIAYEGHAFQVFLGHRKCRVRN